MQDGEWNLLSRNWKKVFITEGILGAAITIYHSILLNLLGWGIMFKFALGGLTFTLVFFALLKSISFQTRWKYIYFLIGLIPIIFFTLSILFWGILLPKLIELSKW